MKFWTTIQSELEAGHSQVLMYVIESNGSSPGRQGFKMAVSQSGLLSGSIGGGIMEHKLVEMCKTELLKAPFKPFIKKQIHQSNIAKNKSGMICSGNQTIAFYYFSKENLELIKQIIRACSLEETQQLTISNLGIYLEPLEIKKKYLLTINKAAWKLIENINYEPQLHIIGGGHVSLALSDFAKQIGFNTTVYDDRSDLNTIAENKFAKTVYIKAYEDIFKIMPQGNSQYVVIMSFGYKTDKIILKSLLKADYAYLGMMGSQAKIDFLFKELLHEGITQGELKKVYAPIGLPIASKTPNEIAISILAQLIVVKNS